MLPASAANGALNSLTRNGQPVAREARIVKGIQYAVFAAAAGSYVATYGVPGPTPPTTPTRPPAPAAAAAPAAGRPRPLAGRRAAAAAAAQARARAARAVGTGTGAGGGTGTTGARAARVRSRTVRASRSGKVKLRVTCPPGESACAVTLRIRKDGRQIVSRRIVTIKPGATRTVTFRLTRSARARLGPRSFIDRRRDRVDPLGGGFPRDDQGTRSGCWRHGARGRPRTNQGGRSA